MTPSLHDQAQETKPCYVYLLQAEHLERRDGKCLVKVGIADVPQVRVLSLMTGCPYPLRILKTWKLPTRRDALKIERAVHGYLGSERTCGEWFLTYAIGAHETISYECIRYWVEDKKNSVETLPAFLRSAGFEEEGIEDYVLAQYGEAPWDWVHAA